MIPKSMQVLNEEALANVLNNFTVGSLLIVMTVVMYLGLLG